MLSKAQILDHVWNYDFNGEANVVESYISYLRRKIDTTEPRLLHTIRGVGYTLRLPRGVIGTDPRPVRSRHRGCRCGSPWSLSSWPWWPSPCPPPASPPPHC